MPHAQAVEAGTPSLFSLSLTSRFLFSCASFLPSLLDFLYQRMKSSCVLGRAPFKSCQLCSTPLSLKTASLGNPIQLFLKQLKVHSPEVQGPVLFWFPCPFASRSQIQPGHALLIPFYSIKSLVSLPPLITFDTAMQTESV